MHEGDLKGLQLEKPGSAARAFARIQNNTITTNLPQLTLNLCHAL
jgi:hypothetical protein